MQVDRTLAPSVTDFVIDSPIQPEVIKTNSGATLHLYKNTIQSVVRLEFVFKAGKWYQPKPGVASLTARMLKEGTTSKSAKQIADTIDFYGASLEIVHGFDRSTLTIYCLSKFLEELIPLAIDILKNPAFPLPEFEIVKRRVIQTLAIEKQKNSYLSGEVFTSFIYGDNHPYATFIKEEDIAALTVKDLQPFHQQHYTLQNAEVFITGDIQPQQVALLQEYLQENPVDEHTAPTIKEIELEIGNKISVASTNTMQASIRIGQPTIGPTHEDYPALYMLNHALGGYFSSRLMKKIREDKGFTYGIYSSLSVKENGSLFLIGSDVNGDKVEETLQEIERELTEITIKLPIEEFTVVKKHLAGKFISDTSTIFDKMDLYKSTVLLGLDANFYTDLQMKLKTLSEEDLVNIGQKYFNYQTMTKVIVGGKQLEKVQ